MHPLHSLVCLLLIQDVTGTSNYIASTAGEISENELGMMLKETFISSLWYGGGICLGKLGKPLKYYDSPYSGYNSNRGPPECKSESSPLEPAFSVMASRWSCNASPSKLRQLFSIS
jgi:hypothetical protein